MAIAKRRKKFFDVEIPIIGKETQFQAYELEDLEGRYSRYDLTRILRGKSAMIQLKVSIENHKAIAKPTSLVLLPYYLRRMIRKGTNYVEDSFSTNSRDAQIRLKPFLITRRKVSRAVRKALRAKAKEELIAYAKGKSAQRIFDDILKNKIQKDLSLTLKKIYPLSLCEIKEIRIEKQFENVEPEEIVQEDKKEEVEEEKPKKKKAKSKESEEENKEPSEE